ncbi:hypothetical protein [Aequorivita sp. Q41]|uniref:hypothetical protein n=1 Tax=Aequorivita sp. Q41 TaxID=3153300 RepID=UPI003242C1F9
MSFTRFQISFAILFFLGIKTFSQTHSKEKIFETYDKIIGLENTNLFNGSEFTDLYLNTDGTYRYFIDYDYTKGSVVYNNQYYVNVSLKYDLLDDNLLTHSEDNLSVFNVKLIPSFIDTFSIYNHNFVRLDATGLDISANGFFEVAYVGNELELYIKHTKRKKEKALSSGIQYRFTNANFYVLKSNGNYTIVSSARDLIKLIPEQEEQIRTFYKSYKALYKSNPDSFMTKLILYLDRSFDKANKY